MLEILVAWLDQFQDFSALAGLVCNATALVDAGMEEEMAWDFQARISSVAQRDSLAALTR